MTVSISSKRGPYEFFTVEGKGSFLRWRFVYTVFMKWFTLSSFRYILIFALLMLPVIELYPREERVISFSGYSWIVRQSRGLEGPGPNRFSSSTSSIWLDEKGLHLTLRKDGKWWFSSEVICSESLGYGRYRFVVEADWAEIPPNAVLGLFTYSPRPDYNNREIDIEISRWGEKDNVLCLFTLQPNEIPGRQYRFPLIRQGTDDYPEGLLIFDFLWQPGGIHYYAGHRNPETDETEVLGSWVFNGNVPPPGDERVRMNLWLYKGGPAEHSFEVTIKSFVFEAFEEQSNERN